MMLEMDKFELAIKLYDQGYEHREVRAIWAYAWNEQNVGVSGKKRKPWQLKALENIAVTIEEIEFTETDGVHLSNYF